MGAKILIIEDDADISRMLETLLEHNGYNVISAYSGTEGLLVHDEQVDLILLDLMLPGKRGEDIIKDLKERHDVPLIVMSAIHDINKKVDLFAMGADDYITKPFHNEELIARICARLRSHTQKFRKDILTYKDIELCKSNFSVKCAGREAEFSKHEFALLQMLMENPDRTCTKSMIYDNVWDYENSADDNTLNVHISKIRKKLKECNPGADYIETVWGIGYRLRK